MSGRGFRPWNVLQSRSMRCLLGCGILLVLAAGVLCVADAWVERPKKPAVRPRAPWEDDPAVAALRAYGGIRIGGADQVLVVDEIGSPGRLDDAALANVQGWKYLTLLLLPGQKGITSSGLQHIAHLTNLEGVDLSGSSVDDSGLKYLENLSHLERLYLAGCPITDEGIKHLAKLQELRRLCLNQTQVTDAGLKYLQSLSSLEGLELNGTRVIGTELKQLRPLTKLKCLGLCETTVSQARARELQQILPEVEIFLETGRLRKGGQWEPEPGAGSRK